MGIRYLTSEPSSAGPSDVAEEVLAKAQEALFLLHRTLDPALADEAAIRIANSGMIYAFGAGGNSSMIASKSRTGCSAWVCAFRPAPITACS